MGSGVYRGQGYAGGYRAQGYVAGYPSLGVAPPPASGLKLWLKGDAGITLGTGSNVAGWADQSGNGNDVAQATGANQPSLTASSINGLPGVTFAASTLLSKATSILASGSDRSIFAVCLPKANTGGTITVGGCLVNFKTAAPYYAAELASVVGATYGWTDGTVADSIASPPTILNTPSVFELKSTVGALPTFAINATSYSPAGGNNVTSETGTDGFTVGNRADFPALLYFAGDICEVLIYNRVLSGGDLTTVRAYLQSRYAIALGAP